MKTDASLYDRLGSAPAIEAAAELFYRKALSDPLLEPYFTDVDMDAQIAKQAAFLTLVLGGPHEYTGRDLRTAHAGLGGLDDRHFDKVLGYLAATLRELGAPDQDVAAAGALAASVRDEVLNR